MILTNQMKHFTCKMKIIPNSTTYACLLGWRPSRDIGHIHIFLPKCRMSYTRVERVLCVWPYQLILWRTVWILCAAFLLCFGFTLSYSLDHTLDINKYSCYNNNFWSSPALLHYSVGRNLLISSLRLYSSAKKRLKNIVILLQITIMSAPFIFYLVKITCV